ncbi:MAG TPA: N-acetyltransferase [Deltaproteobacteria bacterium]|nr:N-acetyltransferase [Deltaproteobacteria bacterium]HQI00094.1 N-acetyltransferase [Deltaproteobacteria bacterium]HQJ07762.1 N-acetyltransferase [Deltaproteobacteria bacterium]
MDIEIRRKEESDHRETGSITREAFWDLYRPGCVEHLLVHRLRRSEAFIPELDYVACDEGRIVGSIVSSKALAIDDDGNESKVLSMGPLCVLLSYQGNGIGSLLLRTTK